MMISTTTPTEAFKLAATNEFGSTEHVDLQPDQGIFVGTSSNCGLQLRGEGLSEIHCRIAYEGGKLWVQDWMSTEGTCVNGESIAAKVELRLGDRIEIGRSHITVYEGKSVFKPSEGDKHADHGVAATDACVGSLGADEEAATADTWCEEQSTIDQQSCDDSTSMEPVPDASEPLCFEADFFELEEEETYDRETVTLLRAEIESLQSALAQRDALQTCDPTDQPWVDAEDSVAHESDDVLQRMQELIDEANRSDERVAILDEMLRAAEETSRSEQEERSQLEAWVGDIESRVGQRENEHLAEIESFRQRLEVSTLEQQRLQRQLQQAAFRGSAPKQYEETLESLQQDKRELREKLAESEEARVSLEHRLEQLTGEQEGALREERANIAKEQAKIARLRFELSSKLAEIEALPKEESTADKETAHRIQTLREHLREIHEQEKKDEKEASLTTRLAKLWKRVEY